MEGLKIEEAIKESGEKYRSILHEETENTHWRHGGPPIYDAVNKLFEEGRTMVWEKGSLEETVQNAIKSWEMELSHKTRIQDFKTINPEKFKLIVNGREGLSAEETLKVGSYNALLKNTLPDEYKYYKAEEETFESSHDIFRSAFPRGFAWEVISVHSGPPVISYKFRHWGYFEGPYKGHSPTGEMVDFYGKGILKVDESLRAEDVEIYYDPADLISKLLKGPLIPEQQNASPANIGSCPFKKPESLQHSLLLAGTFFHFRRGHVPANTLSVRTCHHRNVTAASSSLILSAGTDMNFRRGLVGPTDF